MRVMVFVKANKDSEAGIMPSTELLTAMGKFNEELVKAGVHARRRMAYTPARKANGSDFLGSSAP